MARFMVYNSANRGAANSAQNAMVRMLGIYGDREAADAAITRLALGLETRMWPLSTWNRGPDGTTAQPAWRPITCLNIIENPDELEAEYASIQQRVDAWTALREQACADVAKAAETRTLRPIGELLAVQAMAAVPTEQLPGVTPAEQPPADSPTAVTTPLAKRAEPVSRDVEVRGQTWALVGILGDAAVSQRRAELRQCLGRTILEAQRTKYGLPADAAEMDILAAAATSPEGLQFDSLQTEAAKSAKAAFDTPIFTEEPLVAFFEASDSPEALQTLAQTLADAPELKHADLAVVRLYEWIKLDHVGLTKASRTCRNSTAAPVLNALKINE